MDETALRVLEIMMFLILVISVGVFGMKVSYKMRKYQYLNFGLKIFTEYNRRYAELNGELISLHGKHLKDLCKEDRDILHQYLNLCAEQKYWLGHTDRFSAMKEAWREAVSRCCNDIPAISELWELEKKNWRSYYLESEDENLLT